MRARQSVPRPCSRSSNDLSARDELLLKVQQSLFEVAASLTVNEGRARVLAFADSLALGQLHLASSPSDLQRHLGISNARIRAYLDVLQIASDIQDLVVILRSSAATAAAFYSIQQRVEVAWTFPGSTRPSLRTTGGVAREIIDAAQEALLVVGYAVTVDSQLSGLAAQTVDAIARASERGVDVVVVLHRAANRLALLQAWRSGVPLPSIFTWPPTGDPMAAIHAKLLIADRNDALVTSANLTYHGFEKNLEMGLRVTGGAAANMDDGIRSLITSGELVEWS